METLVEKVTEAETSNGGAHETTQDLLAVGLTWVKAIVEKPFIENEKVRAAIKKDFADTKKKWMEAAKIEIEIEQMRIEFQQKQITWAMDNIERVLALIARFETIKVVRAGADTHLFLGGSLSELGEALGDSDR